MAKQGKILSNFSSITQQDLNKLELGEKKDILAAVQAQWKVAKGDQWKNVTEKPKFVVHYKDWERQNYFLGVFCKRKQKIYREISITAKTQISHKDDCFFTIENPDEVRVGLFIENENEASFLKNILEARIKKRKKVAAKKSQELRTENLIPKQEPLESKNVRKPMLKNVQEKLQVKNGKHFPNIKDSQPSYKNLQAVLEEEKLKKRDRKSLKIVESKVNDDDENIYVTGSESEEEKEEVQNLPVRSPKLPPTSKSLNNQRCLSPCRLQQDDAQPPPRPIYPKPQNGLLSDKRESRSNSKSKNLKSLIQSSVSKQKVATLKTNVSLSSDVEIQMSDRKPSKSPNRKQIASSSKAGSGKTGPPPPPPPPPPLNLQLQENTNFPDKKSPNNSSRQSLFDQIRNQCGSNKLKQVTIEKISNERKSDSPMAALMEKVHQIKQANINSDSDSGSEYDWK